MHQRDADADRVDERDQHRRPHVGAQRRPGRAGPRRRSASGRRPGSSRTRKRQILRPSRRKKNVAKSTSKSAGQHLGHASPRSTSAPLVEPRRVVGDPVCAVVDVRCRAASSDRCSGPVCSQSWICRTPSAALSAQLRRAGDELVDHQGQRADHRGQAADQHHRRASDGGTGPAAASRTAGDSSADSSSAIASGMTTMRRIGRRPGAAPQPTTASTISRQDQAAAIRRPCGTSASSRLVVDGCDRPSTVGAGSALGADRLACSPSRPPLGDGLGVRAARDRRRGPPA